ncbi:MAG: hypothetical protein HDR15_01045 [Lachnospiraceae bacterium]|nr:hypothetical protein [Lachnospiraceae bacterium]
MKFLNKLEKKLGKYAIPNLSLYLILCYAAGYLIQLINSSFVSYLTLNPYAILRGQVWRLVSWVLIPPGSSNIFFLLIMLMLYYSLGTTLERTWGTFYYNVYIFGGILFTVIASFLLAGWLAVFDFPQVNDLALMIRGINPQGMGTLAKMQVWYQYDFWVLFSTYYINMSIFLAFSATYPDMQVMLWFIIPMKVKYLGIVYVVLMILDILQTGWLLAFTIGASLLNFIIFFMMTRGRPRRTLKQRKRQMEYRHAAKPKGGGITRHKCAICGRTEEDDPTLEFRFCSKCEGNYEYCQNHLFTHEHVKRN